MKYFLLGFALSNDVYFVRFNAKFKKALSDFAMRLIWKITFFAVGNYTCHSKPRGFIDNFRPETILRNPDHVLHSHRQNQHIFRGFDKNLVEDRTLLGSHHLVTGERQDTQSTSNF